MTKNKYHFKLKQVLSIVPRKLTAGSVPSLPVSFQIPDAPIVIVFVSSFPTMVIFGPDTKSILPPSLVTVLILLITLGFILSVVTESSGTLRALRLYGEDVSSMRGNSAPVPAVTPSQYFVSKGRSNGVLLPRMTLNIPLFTFAELWVSPRARNHRSGLSKA